MTSAKRRRLDSAMAALQQQYGVTALRRGSDLPQPALPPSLSTTFTQLDALTGCHGVPLGALTLLSGGLTSGKLTLAYKLLVSGQHEARRANAPTVALIDCNRTADPDYLARCGVDLTRLLVVRPQLDPQVINLLLDLIASRQLRVIVLDSLPDLTAHRPIARQLHATLDRLTQLLRPANCALIAIDEPSPPWQRWLNLDSSWACRRHAALHLELHYETWLAAGGVMTGYQAQAHLLKSRWAPAGRTVPIAIHFNGTVQAQPTW